MTTKMAGKLEMRGTCAGGHKDRYHLIVLQVVESDVTPELGLKTCLALNLVKRVYSVNVNQRTDGTEKSGETIEEESKYKHLFSGIGCMPGEYEIKVDPTVTPVVSPPRKIPHTLQNQVNEELDRMEQCGVIIKVEEPTQWVNPIVIVKKPNGTVRLCLDPRELNKAVLREHYPLKTVEEVAANVGTAKVFSTLDAASGFYQINLAEQSTWLTTFNTPYGRYKFERLPFGIHLYFGTTKDKKLSVDASSYGLGARFLQEQQHIVYSSRYLNRSEKNYAQIEKEMLGIVETDHKPLESLFKKPLSSVPPRLQRMMLKVQQYDIVVSYRPGIELYIADILSRAVTATQDMENDVDEFEVHAIDSVPISLQNASQFKRETDNDGVLAKLKQTVMDGLMAS
ncbi:uncharacterized protein [Argopecten irradians]|uniref:uncharacterized protein n=1 Tax=Argopecten irradians TaxID=31199 RepID=UPI003717A46C